MADYAVDLFQPNLSGEPLDATDVRCVPVRYRVDTRGGPVDAELAVTGDREALGRLAAWLRAPVHLRHLPTGATVWHGLITTVAYTVGQARISFSMEPLVNAIWGTYQRLNPPTDPPSPPSYNTYVFETFHAASVARFGKLYGTPNFGTITDPPAVTQAYFAARSGPQVERTLDRADGPMTVTLQCRGWWWYATRRLHAPFVPAEATDAMQQVADLLDQDMSDIVTRRVVPIGTGPLIALPQEQPYNVAAQIGQLLDAPTADGSARTLTIDTERVLRVERAATPAERTLYERRDGTYRTAAGALIEAATCPVGYWLDSRDLLPESVFQAIGGDGLVYISEAEYQVDQARYIPRAAQQRQAWS